MGISAIRKFANYELDEEVHRGRKTSVWIGHAQGEKTPLILKLPSNTIPNPSDVASLKHEYDLLKKLDFPGVIHPVEFIVHGNGCVLVLENHRNKILRDVLHNKSLPVAKFLPIAIELAKIIGELHERGIIHKDIKPDNILVNLATHQVELTDFSIASEIPREYQEVKHPELLEGSLPYISPEQTGRINRAIDYRTDFYSLGITFYEMLTGQRPFQAQSAIEMVHCHIASLAKPPIEIVPAIPAVLSKIVMKLMKKNSDERYQSTRALIYDLTRCSSDLKETGKIHDFVIAKQDVPSKFSVSQKLYGREQEIKTLLTTFNDVAEGKVEILLVRGHPGIGKTSLINEVQQPIIEHKGFFIHGKFDQFKRDVAFHAISNAFQDFAQQLLHLPDGELQRWRQHILERIGKSGKVLTDLAPGWVTILGEQPALPELPPQQALNRFYYILHEFIRVCASTEHPLVIFLDDLQWADTSSLNLLVEIISSALTHHLLILGTYRSNEVNPGHPLQQAIAAIQKKKQVHQLDLLPLNQPNVTQLMADTLYSETKKVETIATYIFQKTNGNPFYINTLLMTLFRENLIYFDHKQGKWQWDLVGIQAQKVSDNVVEFLVQRLQKLPEETQNMLQRAACIGSLFDLKTLSIIYQQSSSHTAQCLQLAIDKGLIIPLSSEYRFAIAMDEVVGDMEVFYQFAHDRVQQAAYHVLDEAQRKSTHLEIGRLLLKSSNEEQHREMVIEIVRHFNAGIDLITAPEEKIQVAELNLQAALKAKKSGAYSSSFEYASHGKHLLVENAWQESYHLTFNLLKEYAEAAYLIGEYKAAEKECELLIKHAKTPMEKSTILYMQMMQYMTIKSYEQAFETGSKGLAYIYVGYKIPPNPSLFAVIRALLSASASLKKVDIVDILLKKSMTDDPIVDLIYKYTLLLGTCAYFLKKRNFWAVQLCDEIKWLLSKQPVTSKAAMFAAGGLLVFSLMYPNYKYASQFAQAMIDLSERSADPETIMTVYLILAAYWIPLVGRQQDIYMALKKSLAAAREAGHKQYVAYIYSLFRSQPDLTMAETCQFAHAHYPEIRELAVPDGESFYQIMYGFYYNLCGKTPSPDMLSNADFQEEALLADVSNFNNMVISYAYYLTKLRLAFTYADYHKAKEYMEHALRYQKDEFAIVNLRHLSIYTFLTCSTLYPTLSWREKWIAKSRMRVCYRRVKNWAKHFPVNFLHLRLLMDAEYAQLKGKMDQAYRYYEQAIQSAQANNDVEWEVLIHEQAGKCYLESGLYKHAGFEVQAVLAYYQRQGATRKVEHLKTRYAELLKDNVYIQPDLSKTTLVKTSTETATESTTEEALDLSSLMQASQMISGEINLSHLLEKVLRIVIENAGAERGALLLRVGEEWQIQAQGTHDHIDVLQSIHQTKLPICKAIVDYVIRQGTLLVLADAVGEGEFRQDPYIKENQCHSILCLPLINQGVLRGILYLENNLTLNAFTLKQQQILLSLASQAAIAIENATLYEHVTQLNLAYARFVPVEFIDLLAKESILKINLGDQVQKNMTVMFADIRDFTQLSETLSPQEIFNFLNQFLSYMEPVIHEHGGFIDKYIGDAIMALFPDANDALNAAIAMLGELKVFNRSYQGIKPLRIGIGLNTGPLMLGIVGGQQRLENTVISNTVNLASRIEKLNKRYVTECLVSEETVQALSAIKQYHIRRLALTPIRGKSEPSPIYEVFDHNDPKLKKFKTDTQEEFKKAIELFDQKQYQHAKAIFSALVKQCPEDHTSRIYCRFCEKQFLYQDNHF